MSQVGVPRALRVFAVSLICCSAHAESPPTCVESYFASLKRTGLSLGISRSDAEMLTAEVAKSISFPNPPTVVYCTYVSRVTAWPAKGVKGIPDGDYIAVNPQWLREVLGEDRVQAIALFGHELGHYLGRHFENRAHIPQKLMETEADRTAGCAVARLGGDLSKVKELFSRLRSESGDERYPPRAVSLAALQEGFNNCGGTSPSPTVSRECQIFDCSKP